MPAPRVVRQRKLGKATLQPVLREDQIESAEYSSLQGQYNVETGVEKSEEKARDSYFIWSPDIVYLLTKMHLHDWGPRTYR